MKHLYSIVTMAAATLTAAAVTPTDITTPVAPIKAIPQQTMSTQQAPSRLQASKLTLTPQQNLYFDGEEEGGEEEAEVWTSIGTGKITASFLECLGISPEVYDVEIEETPIEGGRKFRVLPFSTPNNIFANLGPTAADTQNYMVFYAMEDGKNYFEPFAAYGAVPFFQYVTEVGFGATAQSYATFDGESWTVPIKGILCELSAIGAEEGAFYYANASTPMTISFPGAKDYTATIATWICGEDVPNLAEGKCQAFNFKGEKDAAYVKYGYLPGHWEFNMDMAEFASLYGDEAPSGGAYRVSIAEGANPGIYTAFVATFDDKDECKDIKSSYFFILDDDQDNWKEAGTATWNESLYSGTYNNWDSQELTMPYEEHKDIEGFYRLVNPYDGYKVGDVDLHTPCDGHNHYIYIDATVPDQVKIEPSVTGGSYDGRGVVKSLGYEKEYTYGEDPEDIKAAGFYGTKEDNKITFPEKDVVFGEKNYQNGSFMATGVPFEVSLTPKTEVVKIQEILSTGTAEVFDLQGRRVNGNGKGLLIIRQGNKVSKALVK